MESTWMHRGNCQDHPPSTFFPSDGVGVDVARKICVGCPAQEPCLEYALANHIDHGFGAERQSGNAAGSRSDVRLELVVTNA